MINTGKFIFIHLPKTGGTFVSEIINKMVSKKSFFYKSPLKYERIWKDIHKPNSYDIYGPHGTCEQIAPEHKDLPIVSVFRDPFDRYVSLFKFAWWKKQPEIDPELIKKHYPNYPELSFEEYLEMKNELTIQTSTKGRLKSEISGFLTLQFIRYFCKNPESVIDQLNNDVDHNYQLIQKHLFEVKFLKTDRLNLSLFDYLKSIGIKDKHINFILKEDRIMPTGGGRKSDDLAKSHFTEETRAYVLKKEQVLLKLFPEYAQ